MSRRFEVRLGAVPVGELSELPDGGSEFRFYGAYRSLENRPVLGQKFEDDLGKTYRSRKSQRLPDFFANLIPEGRLRSFVEKEAGLEEGDDLGLLAYVGRDLPGAVVLVPHGDDGARSPSSPPATIDEKPDSPTEEAFRFSLAGVQLKFSMLREHERLSLPARDRTGDWIVKFPSPAFPHLPENELSMLTWASRAGFEVPESHLHPVEEVAQAVRGLAEPGTRVLAVRRYDRHGGARIHQEDLAQAVGLPPSRKYEQLTYEALARVVRAFVGDAAVDELLRRLTLVIAIGNNDAHLKNWSLIYPDGARAEWAPVYDQVSTVAWPGPGRELALKLAGVKEFSRLDRPAIERFASKVELDPARALELVDSTLDRLRSVWRELRADLPLPEEHRGALVDHWRRVPLLRASGPLE